MKQHLILSLVLFTVLALHAQERRDRAVFAVRTDAMKDSIAAALDRLAPAPLPRKVMQVDFSAIPAPASVGEFKSVWHQPPILQGLSGMCWCFSTTSLLESEVFRMSGRKLDISELYTIYWEHVEKAREYVRTRGESFHGEGSEANAVFRIWNKYGCVPAADYTGLKPGVKYHDHENTLFPEIHSYLESVKAANAWDEEAVAATVRAILDHYLGAPPATVTVEGVRYTPKEYLARVVRIDPDEYVDLLSLMQAPWYKKTEFPVPDNWWHNAEYHNLPLAEFMAVIKRAIRKGYSIEIGGDMSEPGYSRGAAGMAVIPSWDIPSSAITDEARQFRFSNGTTADDHGLHLVGYVEKDGADWYLVKDSWSSAYNSSHPGYYFFHEDYVKLKMLGCTLHRDAARELLKKFE
jgi:bleomycin hydrolase